MTMQIQNITSWKSVYFCVAHFCTHFERNTSQQLSQTEINQRLQSKDAACSINSLPGINVSQSLSLALNSSSYLPNSIPPINFQHMQR